MFRIAGRDLDSLKPWYAPLRRHFQYLFLSSYSSAQHDPGQNYGGGGGKQEKNQKEKCMVPQDRANNYFYKAFLVSLEKLGGFDNVHLNGSKFRGN